MPVEYGWRRRLKSTTDTADAAADLARRAMAAASNVRNMVLTRDPRISTLEGLADAYTEALQASVTDRGLLHQADADEAAARYQADQGLATQIGAESSRAVQAENANTAAINGERARAQGAETQLGQRIDTVQLTPGPQGDPGQPRFVGEGPPPDPYPDAVAGDYYLDRVSGDLYQLGS